MLAAFGGFSRKVGVRTGVVAALGALCLGAALTTHAVAGAAGVQKVRLGGDRTETRIVIDLDSAATAKVSDEDRRVVLSLPGVSAKESLQGGAQGLVKAWVLDQSGGAARLRIDLAEDAVIKRRFLLPPADGVPNYRYVVDLSATAAAPSSAGKVQFISRPLSKRTPLSLKKVVVIDAGHGGKDPGAQGGDTLEKDVNLASALALKAKLEKTGRYKVVMTRSDDTYVPLDVRVQIARRADADLFISLHADSGPDPTLVGASVYTLADNATGRSAKFVDKDDWFRQVNLTGGDRGVSDILLDLTQRATRNRSGAFAEQLLERVGEKAPLLRRSHREAGLAVLLAPDVPAVLLEQGFVNNPAEAARLRSPSKRAQLMGAVAEAIDDYFSQQTRLASR